MKLALQTKFNMPLLIVKRTYIQNVVIFFRLQKKTPSLTSLKPLFLL